MHPPGYLAISGGVIDLRLSFSPCHFQSAIPAENKRQDFCRAREHYDDGTAGRRSPSAFASGLIHM